MTDDANKWKLTESGLSSFSNLISSCSSRRTSIASPRSSYIIHCFISTSYSLHQIPETHCKIHTSACYYFYTNNKQSYASLPRKNLCPQNVYYTFKNICAIVNLHPKFTGKYCLHPVWNVVV